MSLLMLSYLDYVYSHEIKTSTSMSLTFTSAYRTLTYPVLDIHLTLRRLYEKCPVLSIAY